MSYMFLCDNHPRNILGLTTFYLKIPEVNPKQSMCDPMELKFVNLSIKF